MGSRGRKIFARRIHLALAFKSRPSNRQPQKAVQGKKHERPQPGSTRRDIARDRTAHIIGGDNGDCRRKHLAQPRHGAKNGIASVAVVRGAHVLSMDEKIGDFPAGDVHVRNGVIVAVAARVAAAGAQVIDGKGMICMPGLIDTHWHHWTTFLRPALRADDPKKTYFPVTAAVGQHYTPADSYHSVKLSLAEAIGAGVTTTHNWAHNVRSPAHADAEVKAMRESGLRGRFAYGPAQGMPNDQPMDIADWARMK